MFTDTDSLVDEIEKEDVYEDFYEVKNLFDFRDYPRDSEFFYPVNKKVIGKAKDEFKEKIISEFIRLKSKIYSLIAVGGKEIKNAKGVKKNVVQNINHKEYIDVLLNKIMIRHNMKRIQNKCWNLWRFQNFFVTFWW